MKNKVYRSQKGITLIALVVTIILLLLLAGITISNIAGNNSILNRAKQAANVTDIEQAREIVVLAVQTVQIKSYQENITKNDIRGELEKELKSYEKSAQENIKVTIVENIYRVEFRGFIFNVSEDFRTVEYVQDFNAKEWDKEKTPETAFIWASEDPNDGEDYHTIIGYNKDMVNYTILRIPSRCHVIDIQYKNQKDYGRTQNYSESINRCISRTFDSVFSYGWTSRLPNGGITKIELPATITKLSGAFVGFSTVTEVEFPYSLKEITDSSFYGCTGLTKITIPSSVTKIGDASFGNCSNLEDVFVPDTVTIIGNGVFINSKFYANLPEGEVYLGKVFYRYNGTTPSKVNIKEGTTAIAGEAFVYKVKQQWGYSSEKNQTLNSVYIPDSVTYIGGNAFYNCVNLNKCDMPSKITYIGDEAFRYTNIKELVIKNDIDYIGNAAFERCSNLSNLNISGKIVDIQLSAFDNTPWFNNQPTGAVYINNVLYKYKVTGTSNVTLKVAEGTTEIADYAINYISEISKIILPSTMKRIGNYAISGCNNLTIIELNEGLEDIGREAFSNCSSLNNIGTLPSTLKYIRSNAFYNCINIEFGDLVIPDGVVVIGSYSFYNCVGIKNLKTPKTLKMIAENAFSNCYNIETVELEEGVGIITDGAFYSCGGLTSVKIPGSVYFMGEDIFKGCFELGYITVNKEKDSLKGSPWGAQSNPFIIWKNQKVDKYNIYIEESNITALSKAYIGQKVILNSKDTSKQVKGFEVNGESKTGNYFYMPAEDVTITNVTYDEQILLESSHPYELNQEKVYEAKFKENTAIRLEFDNRTNLDWSSYIYIYDTKDVLINKYNGEEAAGKIFFINDNGVKIKLKTGSGQSKYGFKCTVTRSDELEYNSAEIPANYKEDCIYAITTLVNEASKVQVKFDENANIGPEDTLYIYSNDEKGISQNNNKRATLSKDNIASRSFCMEGNASTILLDSKKGEKTQEKIKFTTTLYETPDNVLESPHNYYNSMREYFEKTISGAELIKIKFDEESYLERNCDKLFIYDESGRLVLQYTGTDIANQTVYITGSYVKIYMTTDGSVTGYGFRCTVEDATNELEKAGDDVILESEHPYKNSIDVYYTANIDGAQFLKVEFDSSTELEGKYCDRIYLYNSRGIQVGYYTGTDLAGKTIKIDGNVVKIRLKTDSSVTRRGFKCTVTGYKIKSQ